mmetsp:Transcript_6103/g.10361  ORF Transcript_6103/g.10361 Transcript_6103/m.10361 type:complete len:161 (-) Transcript_6103:45-527(-)
MTVSLIDFNVSRKHCEATEKMMTKTGNAQFNAPEIYCQRAYTNKVDLWSAGVIMYMLMAEGRAPFEDTNINKLIDKISRSQPPYLKDIDHSKFDEGALALLRALLSKDPADRPSAEECLRNPWIRAGSKRSPKQGELDLEELRQKVKMFGRLGNQSRLSK